MDSSTLIFPPGSCCEVWMEMMSQRNLEVTRLLGIGFTMEKAKEMTGDEYLLERYLINVGMKPLVEQFKQKLEEANLELEEGKRKLEEVTKKEEEGQKNLDDVLLQLGDAQEQLTIVSDQLDMEKERSEGLANELETGRTSFSLKVWTKDEH